MPAYMIDLVCQLCGAPWTARAEAEDEGEALFAIIAEASKRRCETCTALGQFEMKRSRPADDGPA